MRVYLTGGVAIEHEEKLVEERELAGRQGRLAFAFLASERHRPIAKDELVSVVWPDTPPREIETALSAILSKLRTAFRKVSPAATVEAFTTKSTAADVWIDLEHAAIDRRGGRRTAGRQDLRRGVTRSADVIARRPFLAGEEAPGSRR
jgi:DNA-binding SARP family transcriptional activator